MDLHLHRVHIPLVHSDYEDRRVLAVLQFLADDRQLYNWLTALEETGFALLAGVPSESGQLHRIAARVAYLRKTILG